MESKKPILTVTIKDCEIDTFTVSGPGGQHRNSNQTGVRITHRPSGAVGESRETRSQHINKRLAVEKLASSKEFRLWARIETSRLLGQESVEEKVDRMLEPENIRIEGKDQDGRWIEVRL